MVMLALFTRISMPPRKVNRFARQPGGGIGLAKIGREGRDLGRPFASGLFDGGHCPIFAVGIMKDDVRAFTAELQRHLFPDARPRTGHQHPFALHAREFAMSRLCL